MLTAIKNERALSIGKMEKYVVKYGITYYKEEDNGKALQLARRIKGDGVTVVGGSFYLAGKYL